MQRFGCCAFELLFGPAPAADPLIVKSIQRYYFFVWVLVIVSDGKSIEVIGCSPELHGAFCQSSEQHRCEFGLLVLSHRDAEFAHGVGQEFTSLVWVRWSSRMPWTSPAFTASNSRGLTVMCRSLK